MIMKNLKSFTIGFLVALLLCTTSFVYAEEISNTINVVFNSINITLNNEKVAEIGESYILDNGDTVPYSMVYKGTTYVPIRKVAEILDKEVNWDSAIETVTINDIAKEEVQKVIEKEEEKKVVEEEKVAAKIVSVMAKKENIVEVTFDQPVDKNSAEKIDNYKISPNLSITSIELDSTGTKVVITTANQRLGELYRIIIHSIIDANGKEVDKCEKPFASMGVRHANGGKITGTTLEIIFDEVVDRVSAENVENYSVCMSQNESFVIPIIDAKLDSTGTKVVVTMKKPTIPGEFYQIKISNIVTTEGNVFSDITIRFGGVGTAKVGDSPLDTTNKLTVKYVLAKSNTEVEVVFDQEVDKSKVEDILNYLIYTKNQAKKYLPITNVTYDATSNKVLITTASMEVGILYEMEIRDIDKEGNVTNVLFAGRN